nr:hypothetical protein [Magnetofaba australis]
MQLRQRFGAERRRRKRGVVAIGGGGRGFGEQGVGQGGVFQRLRGGVQILPPPLVGDDGGPQGVGGEQNAIFQRLQLKEFTRRARRAGGTFAEKHGVTSNWDPSANRISIDGYCSLGTTINSTMENSNHHC